MANLVFTRRRIRILALGFIAAMATAFLVSRLTTVDGLDRNGNALFPDFAQIYIAGRHILHGEARSLYDQRLFYREVNGVLHETDKAGFYPVYPPIMAVFAAPWALLPYSVAAWLHAILALAAACWLARDMARYFFGQSEDASMAILLFLAFLPLWRTWMFGQNSIWSLAILWGAWRLWRGGGKGDRHLLCEAPGGPFRQNVPVPFSAGLVLALGLFKPQLFIGAWIWAGLWGNRRSRAGLALGLAAGVALGMIFGGEAIWVQWLHAVAHRTNLLDRVAWMTSLTHAWQLAGGEKLWGSVCIEAVMILSAAVWGIALLQLKYQSARQSRRSLREGSDPLTDAPAVTALCLALVGGWVLSPRVFVYDWILAWPLFLAAWKYGSDRMRQTIAWCAPLFWIHDFFAVLHIPVLTLVGLAAFVWLLRQALGGRAVDERADSHPGTGEV
jgi:hypothetical protein